MGKTKEEIIRNGKHLFRDQVDDLQAEYGGGFVGAIEGMMEEYADQEKRNEAIEFYEWVGNHELDFQPTHKTGEWIGVDLVKVSTSDLYDQFLLHLQNSK